MAKASIIALFSACLAVFAGCAKKPVQAPLNYVVPVIGLPPIPVDTSRPGLDTRDLPTAETMAATQRTVRLSPDVVAGMRERRPVSMPYPAEARQQRLAGHVLFRVVIGTAGSIEGITLIETTNPIFVRTAAAAVESWQYRPYLANGKATAVDTTIRVDFTPPRQ